MADVRKTMPQQTCVHENRDIVASFREMQRLKEVSFQVVIKWIKVVIPSNIK